MASPLLAVVATLILGAVTVLVGLLAFFVADLATSDQSAFPTVPTALPLLLPGPPFDLTAGLTCMAAIMCVYHTLLDWKLGARACTFPSWSVPLLGSSTGQCQRVAVVTIGNKKKARPYGLVFTCPLSNVVVVAFRGTFSLKDVWVDAHVHQRTYSLGGGNNEEKKTQDGSMASFGSVHSGFYDLYASLRTSVHSAISACLGRMQTQTPKILVTGHSLGAALAFLAAPDIASLAISTDQVGVYAFGAPRPGDPAFASAYNAMLGPQTFVFQNETDLTGAAPLSVFGSLAYQHVGHQLTFSAHYGTQGGNHCYFLAYAHALLHPSAPRHRSVPRFRHDLATDKAGFKATQRVIARMGRALVKAILRTSNVPFLDSGGRQDG